MAHNIVSERWDTEKGQDKVQPQSHRPVICSCQMSHVLFLLPSKNAVNSKSSDQYTERSKPSQSSCLWKPPHRHTQRCVASLMPAVDTLFFRATFLVTGLPAPWATGIRACLGHLSAVSFVVGHVKDTHLAAPVHPFSLCFISLLFSLGNRSVLTQPSLSFLPAVQIIQSSFAHRASATTVAKHTLYKV